MNVHYKVNVSENQVDTLNIRLKKGVTLCFPKGGIRGDHVLLLTPAQINRLDKAQVEGRRARQVAKNVSYTGCFIMSLARALPFVARALPTILLGLSTGLVVKIKRLVAVVLGMDHIDNMEGNSDMSSASTLEAQSIGEIGGERASTATGTPFLMYKTEYDTFLPTV